MELTGWDSVIFTFTSPRDVFVRIPGSVLARWPEAIVEGLGPSTTCKEQVAGITPERLPGGEGHLIFSRAEAKYRHVDEEAYVPMADGDSPFAVITRRREDVEFESSRLDEQRAADHQGLVGQTPEPYRAWLCTPLLVEVTSVTPGDPTSLPFSAWVLTEGKQPFRCPA